MTIDTATRTEKLETDLDAFIARRDKERRKREGERPEEAAWRESVRRYEDKRRRETLWDRLRFHEHMMRAHTRTYEYIIGRHRLEVERCEAMLGIDQKGDTAA